MSAPRMDGCGLRAAALILATGWAALWGWAAVSAAEAPPRGDPAARLLAAEHASDVWDLTVALDDGHWVVAQATISNVGPGDRTGAVVGHVLGPDGSTHEFHKVRTEGGWQLSEDRRRIDLDSILFDQNGEQARFYVSKKRVDLDLRIGFAGERVWPREPAGQAYGLDLLAMAAPVHGTLELRDGTGPRQVTGRAILTHRWMGALEAELVKRRVELFGFQGDTAVYLSEVTAPGGEAHRWLVIGREGRIVGNTEEVGLDAAGPGVIALASQAASGRFGPTRELLRDEPLARAPWPVRWWLGRLTRPRFVWTAAPFELTLAGPDGGAFSGEGLVEVARFDRREQREAADGGAPPPAAAQDVWGLR